MVVTVASLQDRDGAFRITARLREAFSTIELVWADGGYASGSSRTQRRSGTSRSPWSSAPRPPRAFVLLRRRWVVERTFAWLIKHCRPVRDYETLPEVHEAMIWTASIWQLSRHLTR